MKTETEIISACVEALIETHPEPNTFRDRLSDGYCEILLQMTNPSVFDPHGRVRAVLDAQEWLVQHSADSPVDWPIKGA